jgi:hypothetical protein
MKQRSVPPAIRVSKTYHTVETYQQLHASYQDHALLSFISEGNHNARPIFWIRQPSELHSVGQHTTQPSRCPVGGAKNKCLTSSFAEAKSKLVDDLSHDVLINRWSVHRHPTGMPKRHLGTGVVLVS